MSLKEAAASFAVKRAVKYARKDFNKNAPKILALLEKADVKKVNRSTYAGLHKVLDDPDNNWMRFAKSVICDTNEDVLNKMIPPIMNVAINSYQIRMDSIKKYGCNVPWAILMDPTAACNLKCTGCWAAEYGHSSSLSYEDLARIISQAKELGTYMYLYTGGEPTMRRKDLQSRATRLKTISEEAKEPSRDARRQCRDLKTEAFPSELHFATQAKTPTSCPLMNIWIGSLKRALNLHGSLHICQQETAP